MPDVRHGVEMDWIGFSCPDDGVHFRLDLHVGSHRSLSSHRDGHPTNCNNAQTFFGLLNFFKDWFWANNPDAINDWNVLAVEYGVNN